MGTIFDELLNKSEVHKKEEVLEIIQEESFFTIVTKKDKYKAKKVVLNSTIYDSSKLFKDEKIKSYYNQFSFNDQSAFLLNLTVKTSFDFLSHYQIILEEKIPFSISNSFFVSTSLKEDEKCQKME